MANLSVEGLSKIVQGGDTEAFFGKQSLGAQERKAEREMQSNGLSAGGASDIAPGKSFSDILTHSVDQVNQYQVQADSAIKELVAGRTKNIHETMLTIERADASLKLMMQVRNKILDAYKEIMRMQV